MTPFTHPAPRQPKPAYALVVAQEDFVEEVRALYEAPMSSIDRDLLRLEKVAAMIVETVDQVEAMLREMEFAATGNSRWPLSAMMIDAMDDELRHGAIEVLRACVAKMDGK